MKTKALVCFFAILCLAGTGAWSQDTEERTVDSFDKIEVSEAIEVYLTRGDDEGVRIEAEGVETGKVVTEVSGETLEIHMERGNYFNSKEVKVYVTYNELESIRCSSAAKIFGESTIEGDELTIEVSSAGKVTLDVAVRSLDVSLNSSGKLELTGKAENQEIEVSSAGKLEAFGLNCDRTVIEVSSGGNARVVATSQLDAEASSGGQIRYKGNPSKRNTDTNSGGAIKAG